jgi:hypothetical protein
MEPMNKGTCIRLTMSDLDRSALEKIKGKTSVVLYIVPRAGLPDGATHQVYQGIPGKRGGEHLVVGDAAFYANAVPGDLL